MVAHACRAFSACMSVQERSEAAVCHIAPGAKSCSVRIPAWNTWRGPFKRDYPTLPVGTGRRIGLSTPELSPRWGSAIFPRIPLRKKAPAFHIESCIARSCTLELRCCTGFPPLCITVQNGPVSVFASCIKSMPVGRCLAMLVVVRSMFLFPADWAGSRLPRRLVKLAPSTWVQWCSVSTLADTAKPVDSPERCFVQRFTRARW